MVADHFFGRGYRRHAVYSLHTERFFEERVHNFVASTEARGGTCSQLPEAASDHAEDWERGQARLVKCLTTLPKPVGVFAANDQLGVRVLDACQRAGIAVPEEVAVVGAENEETLCAFASPPLTSVRFDGGRGGFRGRRAARADDAGAVSAAVRNTDRAQGHRRTRIVGRIRDQ